MLRPIHENILLKEVKQVSAQGIYMPTSQDVFYEVVGIGQLVEGVKVGDKVVLATENIKKIVTAGITYFLTQEKNVLAVWEE